MHSQMLAAVFSPSSRPAARRMIARSNHLTADDAFID
jgi:hypothetical protein